MTRSDGQHLFAFGAGYTVVRLAARLLADGWRVAGTTRNADGCARLEAADIAPTPFARDEPLPDSDAVLAKATHLLISIPPDDMGDAALDTHAGSIAAAPRLRWIGYLSTTGVYGDRGGDWVDERSDLRPRSDRARRRAAAEAAWLDFGRRYHRPVHVFRLAGIYGPGRNVLEQLRAGTAKRIDSPGQLFSRIHVDDIVSVLLASMEQPRAGAIYNVCDDLPAPQRAVIEYGAELLGLPPPPLQSLESAELSPMARSFYADNRRVRNALVKSELGVRLRYADYKAGLRALLEGTS